MTEILNFPHNRYTLKKSMVSRDFSARIFDPAGNVVLYSVPKLEGNNRLKMANGMVVYRDETRSTELLRIIAQGKGTTLHIIDTRSNAVLGMLKSSGRLLNTREKWEILDAKGRAIGQMVQKGLIKSILNQFVGVLPLKFQIVINGKPGGEFNYSVKITERKLDLDLRSASLNRQEKNLVLILALALSTYV